MHICANARVGTRATIHPWLLNIVHGIYLAWSPHTRVPCSAFCVPRSAFLVPVVHWPPKKFSQRSRIDLQMSKLSNKASIKFVGRNELSASDLAGLEVRVANVFLVAWYHAAPPSICPDMQHAKGVIQANELKGNGMMMLPSHHFCCRKFTLTSVSN